MRQFTLIKDVSAFCSQCRGKGKTLGFVPTMGYLHAGHISLVEKSVTTCDYTIVSIFVNPTQFGPQEDLDKYPRNLERDLQLLENAKADAVFFPTTNTMYPQGYKTYVGVEDLTSILCGKTRPTHFRGVTTVVAKLVNITQADYLFMGEKDFQQIIVLKRMLADLNFSAKIVRCPIIREEDGLAKSSRNVYLSEKDRRQAVSLHEAMQAAKAAYYQGITDIQRLTELVEAQIRDGKVDYIEFRSEEDLSVKETADDATRVFLAVYFDKTRLIDNLSLK